MSTNMNTKILEEIGLTKTEIKLYLTLLKLGQSTTTPLIREAGIHASKVYEFLNRLIEKGLVTYVIKANKRYFSAADPAALKELLREQRRRITNQEEEVGVLIPALRDLQKFTPPATNIEVYQDLRGVKSFYEKLLTILKKGDTSHAIGAPRIANEQIEGFLLDWHKERIKRGVKCKYIYDWNVRDYGKIRAAMPLTKVRYFPKPIASPMWVEISNDMVGIGHIKGKHTTLIAIRDREIADGFLDYFRLLWKIAER